MKMRLFLVSLLLPFFGLMLAEAEARGKVDPAMVGTWETSGISETGPWQLRWEIRRNGSYFVAGLWSDSGTVASDDGKWHALSEVNRQTADGTYRMNDANHMLATGPLGTAAWTRATNKASGNSANAEPDAPPQSPPPESPSPEADSENAGPAGLNSGELGQIFQRAALNKPENLIGNWKGVGPKISLTVEMSFSRQGAFRMVGKPDEGKDWVIEGPYSVAKASSGWQMKITVDDRSRKRYFAAELIRADQLSIIPIDSPSDTGASADAMQLLRQR